MLDTKLRIVTVPRDDETFSHDVNAAAVEAGVATGGGTREAVLQLLQLLLPIYPRLQVRQQDSLATYDADPITWYFYRDGRAAAHH
jgi:hypothetical protein